MTSPTNTGPDHAASIGNTVRDIVEHDPGRIDEAWCYKLIRQLLRSIDMQTAMGMPHRAITPDTVAIHDNGAPLLLPLLLSDVRPAVEEDLHALAGVIHYAITRELLPQGPLRGRDLPGYGEPLLTAIDRCMSPDPGERPHGIGELRGLLGIAAVETPAPPPAPAGLDLPGLDLDAIDPADLGPIPDDEPAPADALEPDPAAQLDAIIAELDAAADPDDGAPRPDAPAQESDASARTGMAQVPDPAPAPVPDTAPVPVPVPDTAPLADAARSGDTAPPAVPAQLIKPAQAGPAADAPSVPAADAASARPASSTDDGPVPQPLRPSSPAPLETAAVIPPLSASTSPSVAVGIPPPPLQAGKANAGRAPQAQRRPWSLAVGAAVLVAIVLAGYLGWRGKGPSTPAGRAPAPVEDAGTVPGTGTPAASVPAAGTPDIGTSATGSAGTGTDQAPSAAPSAAPPTTSASTVAQGGTATAPATPAAAAGQPASGNMAATPTPFPAPATAKAPMPPLQPGAPRNAGSVNPAPAPAAAPERPAAASSAAQPASEAPVPNGGAAYRLQIQPWGVVYVDGAERGVSPPLKRVTLAPGRHTIRIANPNFQERALEVDTAEGDGRITVDFAAE
ncbi:hypothetical protein HH212_16725 [Massilia forsythiae]|uniref:PEGA domain-containing protein n=2 Tax=Massilia forsythiae TaxID=2728020 RepID=A0A7Z2ZR12_9BURK|nr:hypothetical protein HH212_16725 [Massilia forsythiae]